MAHPLLYPAAMQLREMIVAGFGGIAATVADVSLLVLQVEHGTSVPLAAFISAAAGAAVGFTLNKYIAFRDRSPITVKQLGRFGLVAVTTALLMALAMQLIAVRLGAPYLVAKVICSALVFLAWTYPAQRRLVFRRPLATVSVSSRSASMSLS
jgi:putative flippase GtrA